MTSSPPSPTARVAAVFDRVADTYESVGVPWFAPIAQGLVDLVAPRPAETAVDVGCGRGAVLFPLARAVGSAGRVVGVDLSPRMIELTGQEVDRVETAYRLRDEERLERQSATGDLRAARDRMFGENRSLPDEDVAAHEPA